MALTPGSKLGSYEIQSLLGSGGMGEVYRARDSRLGREVAIKVLPAERMADENRRRRFVQEARAASALNHPNIVTIYEIESADGIDFIVMEYVPGKTLDASIPRRGMRLADTLRIAVPIADAVARAHAAGIVHRDLKPANVVVGSEGAVKVLDFGLAKLVAQEAGSPEHETVTEDGGAGPLSHPGTVAGTAGYMSPEQATGNKVDARSDVFSFGAMLYEMVTGRRAFAGNSTAETLAAVLREQPKAPSEVAPGVSRDLEKLIVRCLQKDADRRYQSMADVRVELQEIKEESAPRPTTGAVPAGRNRRLGRQASRALSWLGAVVLFGASAFGWWSWSHRSKQVAAPPIKVTPFATEVGSKWWPQLSPDGEKVAYGWRGPDDENWDIYVKALGVGTKPLRLTEHPADEFGPVWSPDGRQVAFVRAAERGGAIYTVPLLGGQERRLTDIRDIVRWVEDPVLNLSWSPDGKWLAFGEKPLEAKASRIVRVSLETREKYPLTFPPPAHTQGDLYPSFSPDGTLLAFARSGSATFGDWDVWVQRVGEGMPRQLTHGKYDWCHGAVWTPGGSEILFTTGSESTSLQRVSLAGGEPQSVFGLGAGYPSIRGNVMVYQKVTHPPVAIWRVGGRRASTRNREPQRLIASSQSDGNQAYSPDGRNIAFASNRSGGSNIWVCDSDGRNAVQLTTFKGHAGTPRWSPDGRKLVLDSIEAGDWNLYVIDADGGAPQRLTPESSEDNIGTWSRDGRWIYFGSSRSGSRQIWKIPSAGGPAVQVTRGGGSYAEESWDGRHLYYANADAPTGIWRVPVAGGEETEVVRGPVSQWSNWALSRSGLYYSTIRPRGRGNEYTIQFLDFASGRTTELFRRSGSSSHWSLAVSPDEEWILYDEAPEWQSELMLVENFR